MRATTSVALLLYLAWSNGSRWTWAFATVPLRLRSSACSSQSILCDSTATATATATRRCPSNYHVSSVSFSSRIRSKACQKGISLKATPSRRFDENEEGEEEDDDVVRPARSSPAARSASAVTGNSLDLDPLVVETSLSFRRISWLSWWAQVILTTVSSVTLLFARNVVVARRGGVAISGTSVFWLAGWGIVASLTSIVWTWGGARLSRRLLRKATTRVSAANMTRRAIRIGILINLIGMGLTLLGAEQIVGGLAIKVLTQQPQAAMSAFLPQPSALIQTVEPLDILVVQANTNTLFSHFCSLTSLLYLTRWTAALDPPSVEGKERPR